MSKFTEKMDWVKGVVNSAIAWAKTYAKRIILTLAIIFAILAILKVSILLGLYFFFSNLIAETTGLDHAYVRSLSILGVVATLMAAPTIFGWLTFRGSKLKVAIVMVTFTVLTVGIVKYKSSHIFFDSATGQSLSYYVETPSGYKFTMDKGKKFDPTYGLAYKPVTKEVIENHLAGTTTTTASASKSEMQSPLKEYQKKLDLAKSIADLLTLPTPDSPDEKYNQAFMDKLDKLCDKTTTKCVMRTENDGIMWLDYCTAISSLKSFAGIWSDWNHFEIKNPKRRAELAKNLSVASN